MRLDHNKTAAPETIGGYCSGHPWYYLLGGRVLPLKTILHNVKSSGYQGYRREEIEQADTKGEPARSQALRKIRDECLKNLRADISRYRQVARLLCQYRLQAVSDNRQVNCADDVHVAVSLKHNHIYNELAHLAILDTHLDRQPDLFGG